MSKDDDAYSRGLESGIRMGILMGVGFIIFIEWAIVFGLKEYHIPKQRFHSGYIQLEDGRVYKIERL